jgi:hypothetical protein
MRFARALFFCLICLIPSDDIDVILFDVLISVVILSRLPV